MRFIEVAGDDAWLKRGSVGDGGLEVVVGCGHVKGEGVGGVCEDSDSVSAIIWSAPAQMGRIVPARKAQVPIICIEGQLSAAMQSEVVDGAGDGLEMVAFPIGSL